MENSKDTKETYRMVAIGKDQRSAVLMLGVTLSVVAVLVAAFLFEYDYGSEYCNSQVCLDEVAVGCVSLGLVSVGSPIAVGVVSFSSFIAIGIIPVSFVGVHLRLKIANLKKEKISYQVAPISIGLLPIGLAYLGYDYMNFVKGRYIFIE